MILDFKVQIYESKLTKQAMIILSEKIEILKLRARDMKEKVKLCHK